MTDSRTCNRQVEMADQRRRPTPSLAVVLCLSLCFTSGQTFDFTSFFLEQCPAKYSTSTYGVLCYDGCEKRDSSYYWCNSREGWDYCSPSNNVDYQGNDCGSPCGDHGDGYSKCYSDGGWNRCARVDPRAMIHYTINQKECTGDCRYHESGGYFWCYTEDTWDYCSPLPDHTYYNDPCLTESKCGNRGRSYSWCYTSYDWDYCGVVGPGECRYSQSNRRKRQADNPDIICSRQEGDDNNNNNNNNNRKVTNFINRGDKGIANSNKKLLNEALGLLNRLENHLFTEQSRSNLVTSEHLRIDNQGLCHVNNQECYNVQIQLNGPRPSGQSTTVAQITAPVGTSGEYMRLGLRESLMRGIKVELQDNNSNTPSTSSNNKPCRRRKR